MLGIAQQLVRKENFLGVFPNEGSDDSRRLIGPVCAFILSIKTLADYGAYRLLTLRRVLIFDL